MKLSFEILSNFAILLEYENSNRISILSNIGFLIAAALVYVNTRVAQTGKKKNKKTTYYLGLHIPNLRQILKRFTRELHQVKTSYF